MVYNYKITNSAYDDIDRALDYIANKLLNISSAKKLYDEIYSKIGKVCKEEVYTKDCSNYGIDDETIRRINVKRYILILKTILYPKKWTIQSCKKLIKWTLHFVETLIVDLIGARNPNNGLLYFRNS